MSDVDRDPAAVRIFDDIGPTPVGDGDIAKLGSGRVDDLVRFAARGCADAIASADGHPAAADAQLAAALEHHKQLVIAVMAMEWPSRLARRDNMKRRSDPAEAERFVDVDKPNFKALAVPQPIERQLAQIEDRKSVCR